MQVGDLVKVRYDDTVGLVTKIEVTSYDVWVWLHTGENFQQNKLELINASR